MANSKLYKFNNKEYQTHSEAIAAGFGDEMEIIILEESYENTKVELSDWLKMILDEEAQIHKYDNMLSVRTYTGYPNYFQKECVELAMWSSNNWYVLETIEEKVLNGSLTITSKEELKAQLPAFVPSV
jgi:hypothetical protein